MNHVIAIEILLLRFLLIGEYIFELFPCFTISLLYICGQTIGILRKIYVRWMVETDHRVPLRNVGYQAPIVSVEVNNEGVVGEPIVLVDLYNEGVVGELTMTV